MHQIHERNPRELREFGLLTGSIVLGLFGLVLPWLFRADSFPLWPWIVAGVLVAWAIIAPASLRPVYRGWMRFGLTIGTVLTPVILSIVFFFLILPFGLAMRLFREDPMRRKRNENSASYRVESHHHAANHMERPF